MSFSEHSNDGTLSPSATIVAAPDSGVTRLVKNITIQNADVQENSITINFISSGGTRQIWSGDLAADDTLIIDDIYVLDSLKSITGILNSAASASNPDFTTHYADTQGSTVEGFAETSTGEFSSRPASEIDGHLYFPNDGFHIDRYNSASGGVWQSWGPMFFFTPVVNDDFTWVNQNSVSASEINGGVHLFADGGTGSTELTGRFKTAPTAPYTITTAIFPLFHRLAVGLAGLSFRENSSEKLINFWVRNDSGRTNFNVDAWTDASNVSSTLLAAYNASYISTSPVWIRIEDDNTDLNFSVSNDGINFIEHYSTVRTTHFDSAPDEVGFSISCTGQDVGATFISWKEG